MKRLRNLRYRRAFMASNVGVQIATQLHALRTSRGLSQEKLAEEIGMNQARISLMERPDYQRYNIQTLVRFAEFYDVALDVRLVSIKDHVNRILNQSASDLAPSSFEQTETGMDETAPQADLERLAPLHQAVKKLEKQGAPGCSTATSRH